MKTWKKLMAVAMAVALTAAAFAPVQARAASKEAAQPVITAKKRTVEKTNAKACTMKMAVGQRVTLTVKSGKKDVTKQAKYKVSNKNCLSVSKSGVVAAKKAGTAKVTVTYKGKQNVLTVKIAKKKHKHVWKNVYDTITKKRIVFANVRCHCGMSFHNAKEWEMHTMTIALQQALFGDDDAIIYSVHSFVTDPNIEAYILVTTQGPLRSCERYR